MNAGESIGSLWRLLCRICKDSTQNSKSTVNVETEKSTLYVCPFRWHSGIRVEWMIKHGEQGVELLRGSNGSVVGDMW